jgi:ATP phosphoribosyltransferase regulatory subunit
MVADSLKSVGLTQFQISIGEVEYFKGICEEAGLDEDTEHDLRDCISGKNYFAAEELLDERNVPEPYRSVLLKVADMFGNMCSLTEAKQLVSNERSLKAIEHLEKLMEVLKLYGTDKYVSFDLGMLSKYNYYTGVIIKAYTYGVGNAVVKGGRYDNLLHQFGKEAPAIGFVIVIDDILEALARQKVEIQIPDKPVTLYYDPSDSKDYASKLNEAAKLRATGKHAILTPKL